MEDSSLVYNVNLCCICQNPESLELFNTTTTTNRNSRTYVEIINSLFSGIVWIDDKLASNLCKSCSTQLDSFAEFKRLCLEINDRRRQYIYKETGVDDSDDIVIIKTEVKPELVVSTELAKSHQCPSCSDSFDKKVELRRHEKKAHGSSTPGKRGPKRKSTNAKSKTTEAKRKTAAKKPRKVRKKVESSDEELDGDDNDFDGEGNNSDDNDKETKTTEESTTESTPNLSYKPAPGETTCRVCSRTLSSTPHLAKHIYRLHANRLPYKCTVCKLGFRYKDKLDRHMFRHTGSRNYICPICGAKFITSPDLRTHLLTHQDLKRYTCDVCKKGFKVPSALRSHKIIVHTDPSDFKWVCSECGVKFPLKHSLTQHMRRHTDAKKIKCHICPKEFFANSELKNHMVSHTDVRNYKCDLCSEEFKQKQGLDKHKSRKHQIGTVAPIKKLPCGYCGRLITSGDKLRRHERTHTGEKPYKCRLCDMRFICRSYIKGHLRGKHEIDVDVVDFDQRAYYESPLVEEDVPDLRTVSQGKRGRK